MAYFKFCLPFLPLVSLLFTISDAYLDFMVGGNANSWKIPSFPDEFNFWAEHNRFNINDTLSFKYDDKSDSVMVVTEDSYYKCDTTNPVQHYTGGGGDTKILLDRSGPFYFISGAQGHCDKGQKLVVVVMSPDHGRKPDGETPPVPEPSSSPAAQPGCNGGHGLNGGFLGALTGLGLVGVIVLF